ncbi:MAG TPA: YitT family protein, partial [Candidatus Omnitrophota bacterium]|nr:YitT family protein [Candidatus Omnitrophota bacterium]
FVSRRFIFYSLWGMVIYATALSIVNIKINVSDPMLAVMIGGALNGLGVALILRSYGSSGGSEILCVVMNKLFSITVGTGAILINIAVLVPAALFFSVEKVFYTLVFVFVSGMFTNKIFHGMAKRRTAVIVSNQWAAIASALREQKIGVTFLKGQGSFLAEERMLLYSVLVARSVPTLKRIVAEVDPAAFISIMEAADVTGVEVGNQPHW